MRFSGLPLFGLFSVFGLPVTISLILAPVFAGGQSDIRRKYCKP
jgi:hypothetical protein